MAPLVDYPLDMDTTEQNDAFNCFLMTIVCLTKFVWNVAVLIKNITKMVEAFLSAVRIIKTLKCRITNYMTPRLKHRSIHVLPKLKKSSNETIIAASRE